MSHSNFELPAKGKDTVARGGRGGQGGRGGRGGAAAAKKPAAPVISPQAQAELLKDYVQLEPKYWKNLNVGAQMRYITRTDNGSEEFRIGGIVKISRFRGRSKTALEKEFLLLRSATSADRSWAVAWDSLLKIYILPDVSLVVMRDNLQATLATLNENLSRIATGYKRLDERLKKIETRIGP